ncbi:MAG: hypothetical protein BGN88_05225, partial [Clostridiales bacterium 43-6]
MKILKNKYVIFAICLILSGIIAFVIVPTSNESVSGAVEIVRVSKQIEKNTVISDDMLEYATVIPMGLPDDIIKEKQAIIGKVAAVTLLPQDNLVPQKFTDTYSITNKELYNMDNPNNLAVSISVKTLAASMSGKLLPGDVVSLYGFSLENKSLVLYDDLIYVEVLAITNSKAEDLDKRTANSESDTSDVVIPSTITLSVNRTQAKELV